MLIFSSAAATLYFLFSSAGTAKLKGTRDPAAARSVLSWRARVRVASLDSGSPFVVLLAGIFASSVVFQKYH